MMRAGEAPLTIQSQLLELPPPTTPAHTLLFTLYLTLHMLTVAPRQGTVALVSENVMGRLIILKLAAKLTMADKAMVLV